MQENLLLSNFWEDIHENLKTFTDIGNDDSKKVASETLLKFNINFEFVGDFDKLLTDVLYMFVNDKKIQKLFTYEKEQVSTLLICLKTKYDQTFELSNKKLEGKLNTASQLWRDVKEDTETMSQKAIQSVLEKNAVLNKINPSTLEDFGQKIGGAKKDIYKRYENISYDDIISKPLSKSFPEPDYVKLVADGTISEQGALFLQFFYQKIPTKPRKAYRLSGWSKTVQNAIDLMMDLITNSKNLEYTEKLLKGLPSWLASEYKTYVAIMTGLGFPKEMVKLGNFSIRVFEKSFRNGEDGESVIESKIRYTIVTGNSIVKDFDTMEDAIKGLGMILKGESGKKKTKETKFEVWRDNKLKVKNIYIGKKTATGVIKLMEGFEKSTDAFTYLKENRKILEEMWTAMTKPVKERPDINKDREGVVWRKDNENITAEKLSQSFGFRGIEFGNYVNNKERQDHVNNAYDALMDMATTIGIDTDTLALGGQLGLAFGARGSGNAMAHYEPEKVVINLTKNKGAGSLAHEYWHALDNFFGKKRNSDYAGKFLTEKPRVLMLRDGSQDLSVNPELVEAFKHVVDVINSTKIIDRSLNLDRTRSKLYWSTIVEVTARCFENYIIEKLGQTGGQNDYLANFTAMGDWITSGGMDEDTFPYPNKDESAIINEAYDQFFKVLSKVGMVH